MDAEHTDAITPRAVLERARAMAAGRDEAGAIALLQANQGRWPAVPPAYDVMLGQLLLNAGQAADAAAHLLLAHERLGGALPAGARRDLAMALLAAGRVETAGREFRALLADIQDRPRPAWVARPACLAAMAAFDHAAALRPNASLDMGPATPLRVVVQAEMLAEADAAAGAALLATHAGDWPVLPASYGAAQARLAARGRDWRAEVARLEQARDACTGPPPAELSLALGAALLETGRPLAAGRALDAAVQGGAAVDRLAERIAIDMHRRAAVEAAGFATGFSPEATLVDQDRRLVYVAIPKNACTELKANFVLNSRYRAAFLAAHSTIHDFCNDIAADMPRARIMGADHVRFTVLRDPFRRLVSAYLNKIVRPRRNRMTYLRLPLLAETIRRAQALVGIDYDPVRSISFDEFVRFLHRADDTQCNPHWMPQYRFTGSDLGVYAHVGTVERLGETFDFLSRRFGYHVDIDPASTLVGAPARFTKYDARSALAQPYRALPQELDAFEDAVPDPAHFYSAELRRLVAERYAADFSLYARAR